MFTSIITKLFLVFLLIKAIIQTFLEYRNQKSIITHYGKVPEQFANKLSLEDHQKAAEYTLAKIKIGKVSRFISVIVLLAWTLGGGLELLNLFILSFGLSEISSGVLFIIGFSLISTIIDLPQSYYLTFILEEKFGFNKTTKKIFFTDMIKSLFLGMIIGIPIIILLIYLMSYWGQNWWIYAWIAVTSFQFFLMWLYPTFIAPIFNKFSPLEPGEVKTSLEELFEETDFQNDGLFVMDASKRSAHGNAYFTGLGKNKRIVLFDTIINTLSPREVKAILAHELGHFKKKHIIKGLIRSILMGLIGFYILGICYQSSLFFYGHGVSTQSSYMALILFSLVGSVYTFLLTPISSYISRKYEFEADEFAAKYTPASDLVSALINLYKDNASTLTPDKLYSDFYHSHPPASIRVKFLESLEKSEDKE